MVVGGKGGGWEDNIFLFFEKIHGSRGQFRFKTIKPPNANYSLVINPIIFQNYFEYIFSHAQLQNVHFHLPVPRGANSIVI